MIVTIDGLARQWAEILNLADSVDASDSAPWQPGGEIETRCHSLASAIGGPLIWDHYFRRILLFMSQARDRDPLRVLLVIYAARKWAYIAVTRHGMEVLADMRANGNDQGVSDRNFLESYRLANLPTFISGIAINV